MPPPDPTTKSHIVQQLRKDHKLGVKRAKWFGPILMVQTWPSPRPEKWVPIVGADFVKVFGGCDDDECECGIYSVWIADFRTGWEKFCDWAVGTEWGPKDFRF